MENLISGISFLRHNIKIIAGKNYLMALGLIALMPCFYSFRMIDEIAIMRVFEMFISLLGLLLFCELMNYKEDSIEEVVRSKRMSITLTFISRVLIATIIGILICAVVVIYGKIGGGFFNPGKVIYGGAVSLVTFGMISVSVFNIIKSTAAAYILAIGYYIFEFTTRHGVIPNVYVMEMMGGTTSGKWKCVIISVILIVINCVILNKKE